MNFKQLELLRFTFHKIYGKTAAEDAYAGECTNFCKLDRDGDETLHKRIFSSLNHKSKFFELDLKDSASDSFFQIQKNLWGSTAKNFLKTSQMIADKAAISHDKGSIPDGLLMIIEAKVDNCNTIIAIKAEKSNAFSMTNNNLQLIKDIFLSSDKTLYKLGFFVKVDTNNATHKAYKYFVYDDAFAPSKDDLAFYFYNKFLGLSTEQNSKLQTNNLYKKLVDFAKDRIDLNDMMPIIRTIDLAFIDRDRKNLNAEDFKSFFPNELSELYEQDVEAEFPNSIIKDNTIVNGLKAKRISISRSTTLILKNHPNGLIIGNTANKKDKSKLKTVLDSGKDYHYVVLPSSFSDEEEVEEEE